ncbi:Cullin-domain-containing protein [Sporormia fimetaria CBS 119925]|uniref:Cullin-domain-containing protein n=1 Tax=Sporormia fimetaria CBS 119925 TaxID=1340428 RepID=A0A6A6UYH0_9PLEO|nr:Cullin-domain-containing protein [Sporormia fimetaria CBS 119925]
MPSKRKHADKATQELQSAALTPLKKRQKLQREQQTAETAAMYQFPSKRAGLEDPSSSPPTPSQTFPSVVPKSQINGGPKRMLVKNFKAAKKVDPQAFFEQVWAKVQNALNTIFAEGERTFSLEELYRGVESLCRQGLADQAWGRLYDACEKYMTSTLAARVADLVGRTNVDLLRATISAWATWKGQMQCIGFIFCYLDRSYLLPKRQSLHNVTIELFRSRIIEDARLKRQIIDGACDLIAVDREGKDLDRQTFQRAIDMFHHLVVYTKLFEPRMLEMSQQYVVKWAEQQSAEKDLAGYVDAATKLMDREMCRVDNFGLDASTKRELRTLLEDHLISKKEARLTNQDEVADLLDQNAVDDLKALYTFLEWRKLGGRLKAAFKSWIEDSGTQIIFNEKEQDSMVVNLLALKRQLDRIYKVAFDGNQQLGHALRDAFSIFMNKTKKSSITWNTDNSKPGEMIAKYVDLLLRGGAKAIPAQLSRQPIATAEADDLDDEASVIDEDTEVNRQLDQVLDLFRFLDGKAVFEAFYKKDLARRLLMGRSASADAERSMLARLKTECGAGFTANLEQMFKDIELSREEMATYKNILEERRETQSLDLSVNVISASAWPSYPKVAVIIPPKIQTALDKFTKHYQGKHSGRKLEWRHALAHCQVKANFPKGTKELVVSSFQAIVLLLFNDVKADEHIDYNYVKQATGLPEAELKRTLQSLACAKLRPLTKHPKGRDINPTDTFTLNISFSDPKYRVKINTVQLKETPAENKETHERVAADRNYETQAAIVRILKARQNITHNELIAETIKVTRSRGTLDVGGIKKNIDRLIEKEFLEREEDGTYSYVA